METIVAYYKHPPRSSSADYSCPTGPWPDLLFDTVAVQCDYLRCRSAQPWAYPHPTPARCSIQIMWRIPNHKVSIETWNTSSICLKNHARLVIRPQASLFQNIIVDSLAPFFQTRSNSYAVSAAKRLNRHNVTTVDMTRILVTLPLILCFLDPLS